MLRPAELAVDLENVRLTGADLSGIDLGNTRYIGMTYESIDNIMIFSDRIVLASISGTFYKMNPDGTISDLRGGFGFRSISGVYELSIGRALIKVRRGASDVACEMVDLDSGELTLLNVPSPNIMGSVGGGAFLFDVSGAENPDYQIRAVSLPSQEVLSEITIDGSYRWTTTLSERLVFYRVSEGSCHFVPMECDDRGNLIGDGFTVTFTKGHLVDVGAVNESLGIRLSRQGGKEGVSSDRLLVFNLSGSQIHDIEIPVEDAFGVRADSLREGLSYDINERNGVAVVEQGSRLVVLALEDGSLRFTVNTYQISDFNTVEDVLYVSDKLGNVFQWSLSSGQILRQANVADFVAGARFVGTSGLHPAHIEALQAGGAIFI